MLPELIVDELLNTSYLISGIGVESFTKNTALGKGFMVRLVPLSVPVTEGFDAMILIL